MSATPEEKERGSAVVEMNNAGAMKGEAQDERLHRVGDRPSDQGAADGNTGKMSVSATNSPRRDRKPR